MNEPLWVVVNIAENGVIHTWGPYQTPHAARLLVNELRRHDRQLQRGDGVRYAVCQVLDSEPDPVQQVD